MMPRLHGIAMALAVAFGLPAAAQAEDPARLWVQFVDKGPAARGDALPQALASREAELPERTLARRHRARGRAAVDVRDLPVSPDHIARVQATGARVRVRSRWLNAISVEATAEQRARIAALDVVSRITPVARGRREPEPPLGSSLPVEPGVDEFGLARPQLELIGVTTLQRHCGLTGNGVVVGVQDTGFDLDHQAFAHLNVLAAHDFVDDDDDVGTEPGDSAGQASHGTRVLGMLAGSDPGMFMGAAPGISVILSKTEDDVIEAPIEEDYYVAGLEWIELQGADVFSASLVNVDWYEFSDFDGQTAVSSIAVNAAFDNGLVVLAALGNFGPAPMTLTAPGDALGALGIGAVNLEGVVAGFSARGPTADGRIKPDVAGPGSGTTTVQFGTTDQYVGFSGTSAATPLVAGLVALVLEARPTLTAQELAELLRSTASQAGAPDNDMGFGLVDGLLASGDVCGCNDSDADGYVGVLCGGDDCHDGSAAAYPGAAEICDGFDDDCDGDRLPDEVDADGDGVLLCAGDCDDDDDQVAPGLPEICGDGLDNDCADGDEPCPASTGADGPLDTGDGIDGSGTGLDEPDSTTGAGEGSAAEDEAPAGCACGTTPGRTRWWGALVLLVGLGRRRRTALASALLATLTLVACNDPGSASDGSDSGPADTGTATSPDAMDGCELPVEIPQLDVMPATPTGFVRCNDGSIHRTQAVECGQPMPTGITCDGQGGSCDVDADCDDAPHGACLYTQGFFAGCACVYGCASDADCATGQLCACGGSAPGYPESTQCIDASCSSDAACDAGLCGLGHDVFSCGERWVAGCRSPEDTCVRPQDCDGDGDNCLPADTGGAWACMAPADC
jgi:MYXO-CTERM domain-containing protein